MAALSSSKGAKEERRAISLKNRLDMLGCPYTVDVEQSWISELLCKPGEPRIRILQWLFSKFDSDLSDLLDIEHAPVETRMDSRLQRLLHVSSTLGLCQYDDVDLVRGVTGGSKQATFLDQLIDMVSIADSAEDPHTKAMVAPGTVSGAHSLADQVREDQSYLCRLVDQERMDTLFHPSITLLPPDISRQLTKGGNKDGLPVPDFQQLVDSYKDLLANLQRQTEILGELKAKFEYEGCSDTTAINRTLGLALSELAQLMTGFMYSFENEIEPWCNKSPPELTQLGPAVKRVHTLLTQLKTFQGNLRSIQTSHEALKVGSRQKMEPLMDSKSPQSLVEGVQNTVDGLRECVSVLEESVRRNASFMSSQSSRIKT